VSYQFRGGPDMAEEKVVIELSKAEALVLFDLLARFDNDEKITIEHQSEERVLWDIQCSLEKILVEPFMPNYTELPTRARNQVADQ
jgi:hypothetical protein